MKTLFHGPRFDVNRVVVNDNVKDYVAHPGAVVILPILGDQIVFIKNERFAVGKTLIELPAGTKEVGEVALETAKRELIEETGYKAGKIIPLLNFYTTPGFCNEEMEAFVATDLEHVGQKLEPSEKITVHQASLQECLQWISESKIIDGKTITTLLYYDYTRKSL